MKLAVLRTLLLLILCLPARPAGAESMNPAALTVAALKVATWNLNWLTLRQDGDPALPGTVHPRSEADFAALRRYAAILDADVVAFQEVDGAAAAARIFPPDRYDIVVTDDRAVQRTGFAIRHGLHWRRNADLQGLDLFPDAPHPLRAGADITLDLRGATLRLLDVHLKTGCWAAALDDRRRACTVLRAQLPALQQWLAARQADHQAFVLLGDFNRRMDRPEAMLAALDQAAPMDRLTAGHLTPCWGGEQFIDHILAGGAARRWAVPGSLRVLVYRETDPDWKDRLSDHCAVSVRFELPGGP